MELLYDWENRSDEWWLGAQLAPVSRAALERFAAGDHDVFREGQIRLMLSHGPDTVAALDLYDVDFRHRRAGVGVVVAAQRRGEGHGRMGLKLLAAYALQHLGMHQLYAEIPAEHAPSLSLFASAGFIPCATLPDWIKVGAGWQDVVVMRLVSLNGLEVTE